MAAPKLSKGQKDEILKMLAARETYQSIAKKVGCTWANIDYYAKKYSNHIKKLREERDSRLINQGLRTREVRIERLEKLAELHEEHLFKPAEVDKTGRIKSKGGLYAT